MASLTQQTSSNIHECLRDKGYDTRTESNLMILKTTDKVVEHTVDGQLFKMGNESTVHLKGLIFDSNGTIVAPGCPVPLESPKDEPASSYTKARDGVLFRIYYHDGSFRVSTSGMITPNRGWGPRGCKTFLELFQDVEDQWDKSKLDKKNCYYCILEHSGHTNVIKHDTDRLTLVRIVAVDTLQEVPLDSDTGFLHHEEVLTVLPDIDDTVVPIQICGYNHHWANGDYFRKETTSFKEASALKPNLPDPRQHWVVLKQVDCTGAAMRRYLEFFPWHSELFQQLSDEFLKLADYIVDCYYQIRDNGLRAVRVKQRCYKYMLDLLDEIPFRESSAAAIENHILNEDCKRILYMLQEFRE